MEALAAVICVVSLASRPRRRLLSAAKTLSAAGGVIGGSSVVTGSGFWVSKISWAFCETANEPPAEFSTWRVAGELVRLETPLAAVRSTEIGRASGRGRG